MSTTHSWADSREGTIIANEELKRAEMQERREELWQRFTGTLCVPVPVCITCVTPRRAGVRTPAARPRALVGAETDYERNGSEARNAPPLSRLAPRPRDPAQQKRAAAPPAS